MGIGIERQAIGLRQVPRPFRYFHDRRVLVEREHDVLGSGQRIEQREMLEHHADAELPRHAGTGDPDGLALPQDLARIGLQRTEKHLDQRRLAGAVFAEEGVDLALLDREVDGIARFQRAEDLRQTANL